MDVNQIVEIVKFAEQKNAFYDGVSNFIEDKALYESPNVHSPQLSTQYT